MAKHGEALSAALVALALAGCSGGTQVSLSAAGRSGGAALRSTPAGEAVTAGPGVDVTRVRFVVDRIRLSPISSSGSGVSGDRNVAAGPYLVDLTAAQLASGIRQVFDVAAPAGDYDRLKIRIHALSDGERTGALADFPSGQSIEVTGTVSGAPFTFTSNLDEEQEYQASSGGSAPLLSVKDGATANVTLSIDPSGWFTAQGGGLLDPRDAGAKSQIVSNVKASIDAFQDDDRNGRR